MKLLKSYLRTMFERFGQLDSEFKNTIVIAPIVLALIVAVIAACWGGFNDYSFIRSLLHGLKCGGLTYLWLNIIWWGGFFIVSMVYCIVRGIGEWVKKP